MPKSGIKIKINVVTVNFWFSFSPRNQFRIFHPPVFFRFCNLTNFTSFFFKKSIFYSKNY